MDSKNKRKVDAGGKLLFLGSATMPLAVWLSQWGYDVDVAMLDEAATKRAKYNAKMLAGIFRNIHTTDYFHDLPHAMVTVNICSLNEFQKQSDMFGWIDLILNRCREFVCAVYEDRSWIEILRTKYKVDFVGAPIDGLCFISIQKRQTQN